MSVPGATAEFAADVLAEGVAALDHVADPTVPMGARIAERLRADGFSRGWLDLRRGEAELSTWPDIADRELMVACTASMPATHPVLGHWMAGATEVASVSRLVRPYRSRWMGSAAYALLKQGVGSTETVGIRLDSGTATIEMLGFTRARDFSDDEIRVVEVLQRPMIALHRHAKQLARWRADEVSAGRIERAECEFSLTPRELEVLMLLAEGLLASSIAARLAISTRTVHRHLGNIYAKLGTHDRLSTVMLAASKQLIPVPRRGRPTTYGPCASP